MIKLGLLYYQDYNTGQLIEAEELWRQWMPTFCWSSSHHILTPSVLIIYDMAADSFQFSIKNVCMWFPKWRELSVRIVLYTIVYKCIWKSVEYLKVCCLPTLADSSASPVAASPHLLEDPTSGFGSSCLSHIVRSHGESFWQLLHPSSPVLFLAFGMRHRREEWSIISVTNTVHLCCGIIWHLRLGALCEMLLISPKPNMSGIKLESEQLHPTW